MKSPGRGPSMKGSRRYGEDRASTVEYDAYAAENLPRRKLKTKLCELGERSNGGYCKNCESQCAYGRRYIECQEMSVNHYTERNEHEKP